MSQRVGRVVVAAAPLVACIAIAMACAWWPARASQTADRNGDGRPDVWRVYDHQRQVSDVFVDTNFDGRSDVHEYYEHGVLRRRDSDRDFSDRVDLVEEFDLATQDQVRAVTDVDFDGRADLLELFQGGAAVYVKWADPVAPVPAGGSPAREVSASPRTADDPLARLGDPFLGDLAMSGVLVAGDSGDAVGLSTSGGLPAFLANTSVPTVSSPAPVSPVALPFSTTTNRHSPRGPPVAPQRS